MPQLGLSSWIIWSVTIAAQPALAGILIYRRLWRQRFSIFAFAIFKSCVSFTLLSIVLFLPDSDSRAAIYFYTYWPCQFVSHLILAWLLCDLCCELVATSKASYKLVRLLFAVSAFNVLGVCLMLSLHTSTSHYGRLVCFVHDLSKALSLGLLASLLIVIAAFDKIAGILLDKTTLGLLIGFALLVTGDTAISWLILFFPNWSLSEVGGVIYGASLLVWCVTLVKRNPPRRLPSLAGLKAALLISGNAAEGLRKR